MPRAAAQRRNGQVVAIDQDFSRRRLLQSDQQLSDGALAAAAFADQSDEFVLGNAECCLLHRGNIARAREQSAANRIVLLQSFDLQQRPPGSIRRNAIAGRRRDGPRRRGANAGDIKTHRRRSPRAVTV